MDRTKRQDPHAKAPVQLTLEEIAVLKECRVNSVYYRGLPLGMVSCLIAKGALDTGYFPRLSRWSKAVYFGVFSLGLFTGITSYKDICFKKIMALENSQLKEQFMKYQREKGMFGNSEFSPVDEDSTTMSDEQHSAFQKNSLDSKDEFESPLLNRMKDQHNSWDNIPRQSSQQQQQQKQQQQSERNGLTYEDIRKRNRIGFNKRTDDQQDRLNETEVVTPPKRSDIETYTPIVFTEDKPSKALNFSSDNDSRLSLYRSDDDNNNSDTRDKNEDNGMMRRRSKGNFTRPVRKNEYGDALE